MKPQNDIRSAIAAMLLKSSAATGKTKHAQVPVATALRAPRQFVECNAWPDYHTDMIPNILRAFHPVQIRVIANPDAPAWVIGVFNGKEFQPGPIVPLRVMQGSPQQRLHALCIIHRISELTCYTALGRVIAMLTSFQRHENQNTR